MHQQVHGEHRLARAGAALDDYGALLPVFLALEHGALAHVEADRLFVEQVEDWRAFDHGGKGILQRFGRAYAAVLDEVEEVAVLRALCHEFLYIVGEFLRFRADEERGGGVPVFVDGGLEIWFVRRGVIMEIRAGMEVDFTVLHALGIVGDEARVGVGLVGRVAYDAVVAGHVCPDAEVHVVVYDFRLGPLLEFDDDYVVFLLAVCAHDDEVHSLRGLRDVVLDCHLHVVCNLGVVHDVAHELHRVLPGVELALLPGIQALLAYEFQDLVRNQVVLDILNELSFCGVIDYHFLGV